MVVAPQSFADDAHLSFSGDDGQRGDAFIFDLNDVTPEQQLIVTTILPIDRGMLDRIALRISANTITIEKKTWEKALYCHDKQQSTDIVIHALAIRTPFDHILRQLTSDEVRCKAIEGPSPDSAIHAPKIITLNRKAWQKITFCYDDAEKLVLSVIALLDGKTPDDISQQLSADVSACKEAQSQ